MEMTEILSRYNTNKKQFITSRSFIGASLSFFLGRAVIFNVISPFGLSFLAAYITINPQKAVKSILIGIIALLGSLTVGFDVIFIKYMLAYVLFGLIYIAVTTLTDSRRHFTVSSIAFVSLAISGIIFSTQTGFRAYDIIMLLIECLSCFIATQIFQYGLPIIQIPASIRQIKTEELIGFYVMVSLAILGFSGLSIGSLSIGNSLIALFIMLIALVGGVSVSTAGGVGIGIISSFTIFPMTEILGIYGFCGLATGIMSKFKRAGVILGFLISNSILSLYFGGFNSGVFSIFETIAGVSLFCLTPKSLILELEAIILNSRSQNITNQKSVDVINLKINNISESFKKIAETFSTVTQTKQWENLEDITILFDKTADKVCKRCGLKFICWEREFNQTYDALNNLYPVLKEKGKAEISNFTPHFANKCIKILEFTNELNKEYGKYKLEILCQQRLQESKELVSNQLTGISKIMDNISKQLNEQFIFDTYLENRLFIEYERIGIKVSSVTILKDSNGKYEACVRLKSCNAKKICEDQIIPIASNVLNRLMSKKDITCASKLGTSRCNIRLIEKENYSISCSGVKASKNGEIICGDNFTYQPSSDGKYIIVLSDGMGCGSKAASQSSATVELMRQFLSAGFDKQTAIKMLNSTLLIKSTDECFATVDIAIIDLFTGNVEFIKVGANTSYIKSGKNIEVINSNSLPAGILSNIDIESTSKIVENGDYIIMISDGIHNVCENWIEDFISNIKNTDEQVIANEIIKEAKKRRKNSSDDMTVIVAKMLSLNKE